VTVQKALELATRGPINPDGGDTDAVIEGLRRSIAIEIRTEPDYKQFIDGLALSETNKAKIAEMMCRKSYQSAAATAREMDPTCNIPSHKLIVQEIMALSPDRLREICETMERPTLLIVSPCGFDQKIQAMNWNMPYTRGDGRNQTEAFVDSAKDSPFENVPESEKTIISITDGVPHPKQLTGVSAEIGERRDYLTQQFAAQNMRHISVGEMATLLQKSLRETEGGKKNKRIVDNYAVKPSTITFLDPNSLRESAFVAYAYFSARKCQVKFNSQDPKFVSDSLRGRATMQLMEY
jgi:hypothetical protein